MSLGNTWQRSSDARHPWGTRRPSRFCTPPVWCRADCTAPGTGGRTLQSNSRTAPCMLALASRNALILCAWKTSHKEVSPCKDTCTTALAAPGNKSSQRCGAGPLHTGRIGRRRSHIGSLRGRSFFGWQGREHTWPTIPHSICASQDCRHGAKSMSE